MFRLSVGKLLAHFRKGKIVGTYKGLPVATPQPPHDVISCTVTQPRPISVVVPST
jgi:hypothetical protein